MHNPFAFSRRKMLQTTACGFGSLALADILRAASIGDEATSGIAPRANRMLVSTQVERVRCSFRAGDYGWLGSPRRYSRQSTKRASTREFLCVDEWRWRQTRPDVRRNR